jgi:D,D-heptose 1,7-bisphosphate phosphatase
MNRAVFLDRDGTLIVDTGFPSRPEEVRILPGVPEALSALGDAGYRLVVVTNQSGIGRGLLTEEDYRRVHREVERRLDIRFDGVYHCPHRPEAKCSCRKPAPGMLLRAAEEHSIDLASSWAVGDRERDVRAGLAAGCGAVLLGGGPLPPGARAARDLPHAVELILAGNGP